VVLEFRTDQVASFFVLPNCLPRKPDAVLSAIRKLSLERPALVRDTALLTRNLSKFDEVLAFVEGIEQTVFQTREALTERMSSFALTLVFTSAFPYTMAG